MRNMVFKIETSPQRGQAACTLRFDPPFMKLDVGARVWGTVTSATESRLSELPSNRDALRVSAGQIDASRWLLE
jgi:hypothetical protein